MVGKRPYKVIDIFAGPGGLGEGFVSLGYDTGDTLFRPVLSIEKEENSYNTLLLRSFYRQFDPEKIPQEYWSYIKSEITKQDLFDYYPQQVKAAEAEVQKIELGETSRSKVKKLISQQLKGSEKWVLVGGPPCQAYSNVGRSRMRSTNPNFEDDERHLLYKEFLQIIVDHRPPVFIMENVEGILSAKHSGKRIIKSILKHLRKPTLAVSERSSALGYRLYSLVENKLSENCEPEDFIVRAEEYGIPQARHRMLILGIRNDIHITPETLRKSESVVIEQAIGDLPKIRSTLSKKPDTLDIWRKNVSLISTKNWYKEGRSNGLLQTVKRIDDALLKIEKRKLTEGAECMKYTGYPKIHREWYRHGCDGIVPNHSSRGHMRSDLHRYLFVSANAEITGKSATLRNFPPALLPAHRNAQKGVKNNHFGDRFKAHVRMRPSGTITSHISKDGNYFIHYDPSQCRSLTVREAARLQTFPDSYKFEGSRTAQYHQVGNAVPPLLSMQIAEIVHDILKRLKM